MKTIEIELLNEIILKSESSMDADMSLSWNDFKIEPQQWKESSNDSGYEYFWVVAMVGNEVIWFNDETEGFNISNFTEIGHIDEYWTETTDLQNLLWHIL